MTNEYTFTLEARPTKTEGPKCLIKSAAKWSAFY